MRSAKELSPKMQISAELYRAVQQLSGPSPLGPGFLINTLLEEALSAPAIIDRARFLLAEALRQYEGELERRKDRAVNVEAPNDTTQRHDTTRTYFQSRRIYNKFSSSVGFKHN